MSTYLLEKSRVTPVGAGARAYHIFYAMLRGLPAAQQTALFLPKDPAKLRYLAGGETGQAGGGRDDASMLGEIKSALDAQVSLEEQKDLFALLAGVQHLGNIVFDPSKQDAASVVSGSSASVGHCEAVLGLQSGMLQKALCKRKIKAGHEFVEQDLKLEQANDGRDALAKAIYSRLFDRLVEVRTGTRLRHRWRPTTFTPRSSRYS